MSILGSVDSKIRAVTTEAVYYTEVGVVFGKRKQ